MCPLLHPAVQVLYPLGVGSELAMVALALPTIRANRPLSIQVGACLACAPAPACVSACACVPVGAAGSWLAACATAIETCLLCRCRCCCCHYLAPCWHDRIATVFPLPQLPNAANFGFDYYWACWLAVLAYLPGKHGSSRPAVPLKALHWCRLFEMDTFHPLYPSPPISPPPHSLAGFPHLSFYLGAQRRKVLRSGRSSSASKLKAT